jgi:hypothetical protein
MNETLNSDEPDNYQVSSILYLLPVEILNYICRFLDDYSKVYFFSICKKFRALISNLRFKQQHCYNKIKNSVFFDLFENVSYSKCLNSDNYQKSRFNGIDYFREIFGSLKYPKNLKIALVPTSNFLNYIRPKSEVVIQEVILNDINNILGKLTIKKFKTYPMVYSYIHWLSFPAGVNEIFLSVHLDSDELILQIPDTVHSLTVETLSKVTIYCNNINRNIKELRIRTDKMITLVFGNYDGIEVLETKFYKPVLFSTLKVLYYYFSYPIDSLPDTLQELHLNGYDRDIPVLPKRLKKLYVQGYFRGVKEFPDSLEVLDIDKIMYSVIDTINLNFIYRSHNNVPDSIVLPKLPPNLKYLKLNYDTKIEKLPDSIEYLYLKPGFKQPLNKLPKGLIELEYGFDAELPELPDTLRILRLTGSFNRDLIHLPKNLKELCIINRFNRTIIVPESLEIFKKAEVHYTKDNMPRVIMPL